MEWLILALILALIPAMLAKSKGRSFFLWYIYGLLIFIIALVHSLLIKPLEDYAVKKCQFCAEIIREEAVVCKFCGRDIAS